MFSEWMVDVPTDFEEMWAMVPCPVAKRTLVIASDVSQNTSCIASHDQHVCLMFQGATRSYNKAGMLMNEFQSGLPGGRRGASRWEKGLFFMNLYRQCGFLHLYTFLLYRFHGARLCLQRFTKNILHFGCDGLEGNAAVRLWSKIPNTRQITCNFPTWSMLVRFSLIALLFQTEFRFYWIAQKMAEMPELSILSKTNKVGRCTAQYSLCSFSWLILILVFSSDSICFQTTNAQRKTSAMFCRKISTFK